MGKAGVLCTPSNGRQRFNLKLDLVHMQLQANAAYLQHAFLANTHLPRPLHGAQLDLMWPFAFINIGTTAFVGQPLRTSWRKPALLQKSYLEFTLLGFAVLGKTPQGSPCTPEACCSYQR